MSPELMVGLASSAVAAIIAVVVPLVSFRLALRQDHTRWVREQRAEVYIDLLTEAYAEQQWMEEDAADPAIRERFAVSTPDLRLPPLERARLGARATMYASRTVNALFNRMSAEHFWSGPWGRPTNESDRVMRRVRIAEVVDELQKAVRAELQADELLPAFPSNVLKKPTPLERRMQGNAQAFATGTTTREPLEHDQHDGNEPPEPGR